MVHYKTDSYIYNLEKFEQWGEFGSYRRKNQLYEQIFLYSFTFWWDVKNKDHIHLKRMKRLANTLNITFAICMIGLLFFFLYMQEVNHTYRHIEQDPLHYFQTFK